MAVKVCVLLFRMIAKMFSITNHLDFSVNHKRSNGKQKQNKHTNKKEKDKKHCGLNVYNFTTG